MARYQRSLCLPVQEVRTVGLPLNDFDGVLPQIVLYALKRLG
jgi:hypothetical protein